MATVERARLWHFHGGIVMAHHKRLCTTEPIRAAALPGTLYVPLSQHEGQPAEPLVTAGDRVLKGQPIGAAGGWLSAPVHAPSSGKVRAVEDHAVPHPSGLPAPCIVIDTDGEDRWGEHAGIDWHSAEPETIRERLFESGVVGLGGATFPSHVKLTPGDDGPVHTLIVNGAECEPYIACDEMLMRERADDIVLGARVLQRACGATDILIAIEDLRPEIRESMERAVHADGGTDLKLALVPTVYPEGGEKQLIQVLTGLEVPAGGLPLDLGLVCMNVATAVAAYRAAEHGEPLISRIVSVTGQGIREPCNFEALIGTPLSELAAQAGGYGENVTRLIAGGPLMGFALASDQVPVTKATNCVLALRDEQVRRPQPQMPCIRCMECVRVCPAQLLPQQLYWHAEAHEFEKSRDLGLFDCIECGCCAMVCPSQIPLVDYYRFAKSELRAAEADRHRADHARRRHEARQARLARQEAEREQRLRKKKEALERRPRGDRQSEIRAAVARARAKKRDPGPD